MVEQAFVFKGEFRVIATSRPIEEYHTTRTHVQEVQGTMIFESLQSAAGTSPKTRR